MREASLLLLFSNRCPHCGQGRILTRVFQMQEKCSECGFAYEREEGQNWGAMVLSYAFGALIAFPLFLVLVAKHASVPVAIGVPTLVLTVIAPFSVRYSRLAWTHVMYYLHPPHDERRS